jgi:hypothetical protein
MPYSDPERQARARRAYDRNRIHGRGWRAVIDFYNGMCAVCGEEMEELHEPFGEDKEGQGKSQARIPMCYACHYTEHGHGHKQGVVVRYLEDIDAEVRECGSYQEWCKKYHVVPFADAMQLAMTIENGNHRWARKWESSGCNGEQA